MKKQHGLIAAYLLDNNGGGKKLDWPQVKAWSPEQGTIWVHLDFTVPKARRWLSTQSRINHLDAKAMLAEETRPRSLITAQHILVSLRGVNYNPGQNPEDMVSIRLWLDKHCIITTRRRHLLSVDDICQALDRGEGPKTPVEFLLTLNDQLLNRMSDVIEQIDEEVDEADETVNEAQSRLIRPKISDIRRQATAIRRYLAPQREAIYRLQVEESDWFSKEQRLQLREANDRIIRYIEDLDSARERATIVQEELASRIAEQTDQRMYVLSIVAVIFLPLSFITGLLGINVGGIPGEKNPWAFAVVSFLLLALALLTVWVFRRKKWM